MEDTRKLNEILKEVDIVNDYNELETLNSYYYSNYIINY